MWARWAGRPWPQPLMVQVGKQLRVHSAASGVGSAVLTRLLPNLHHQGQCKIHDCAMLGEAVHQPAHTYACGSHECSLPATYVGKGEGQHQRAWEHHVGKTFEWQLANSARGCWLRINAWSSPNCPPATTRPHAGPAAAGACGRHLAALAGGGSASGRGCSRSRACHAAVSICGGDAGGEGLAAGCKQHSRAQDMLKGQAGSTARDTFASSML